MNRRGFSMVEMVIVASIIGGLAGAFCWYGNVARHYMHQKQMRAVVNMRRLQEGLASYRGYAGRYPIGTQWKVEMYGNDCRYLPGHFGPIEFCIAGNGQSPPDKVGDYKWTMRGDVDGKSFKILALPYTVGKDGEEAYFADHEGRLTHCIINQAAIPSITYGLTNGMNWTSIETKPAGACT